MIIFGSVLVALPWIAQSLFALMVFGATDYPVSFSDEAMSYIRLAHAVMGAVIVGWFILVLWVVRSQLARGTPDAWRALTACLGTWFILDTAFSLVTGYWQNAALNTTILMLFLPGLVATRPGNLTHPGDVRRASGEDRHSS
jgi:hypothetical protein